MIISKPNQAGINQAIAILKKGGVVVYPTDTAYALGGIYKSKKVGNKILKIKNRTDKKFTLVAASLAQVNKYFKLNACQQALAKKYWPGSLSLVVSARFAVRVPKNYLAQILAKKSGQPLIATSANISGRVTIYDSQKVIKEFLGKKYQPDLILANGCLPKRKTSTIVQVFPKEIKIIRQGAVKIKF
ncbi:MAG: L-threonylcarbamoyladenylate synthase [Candidatus Buchananbacteria bacterium]